MSTYVLTYARTVILKRWIEAQDRDDAMRQATALENDGELGLATIEVGGDNGDKLWLWDAKAGSVIDDIQDQGNIWELEEDLV